MDIRTLKKNKEENKMNAMYYKINLPKNYDMNIIRERVENNGSKTDGFPDLFFKAYLIRSDKEHNEYSPFYIWKNSEGMNKFIFEGFFDNILDSFGWQNINIGIPLTVELDETFRHSKYCIEIEHEINQTYFLSRPEFSLPKEGYSGKVLVYNPDKWRYMELYFYKDKPENISENIYEILHISQ